MGRRSKSVALAIYLNGRRVGTLLREPDEAIAFTYHDDWLSWDHAFPVSLSLPLRPERQYGSHVVAVFDNLLPDNDKLRKTVAARMAADGTDPHSLLAAIGRDCVGAMQFVPDGEDPRDPFRLDSAPIDDGAIEALLNDLEAHPLGLDPDQAFRISIAGAQEKTALLRRDDAWHIPHGLTPTTHILKKRMGTVQHSIDMTTSLENEFLCLRLAAAFGFDVNHAWIERFGETDALVIERFDRTLARDGRMLRRPQEDFCQALGVPSHLKNEQDGGPGIAASLDLLQGSVTPMPDRATFFAAQIFFWMIGATDGHAKNFSIFLDTGGFRMTPLYDIMSAEPAFSTGQIRHQQMQLAMAVSGKSRYYRIDQIHPRHFFEVGARAGGE
ncbi:HipA domain-containing protein [Defluviimonas sp. SAOS-178_SWC]|uniref:HipA domain-containing protein n=1 Tax=Defluviimonas sp. SAOS-178_SWC TaxID=3121287 RepID=UPI00322158A4